MPSKKKEMHPFDALLANAGSVANSLRKQTTVVNSPWTNGFYSPLSSRGADMHDHIQHNKARVRAAALKVKP